MARTLSAVSSLLMGLMACSSAVPASQSSLDASTTDVSIVQDVSVDAPDASPPEASEDARDGAAADSAGPLTGPTDICFDTLVVSGMGFGWKQLNHRISRYELVWSGGNPSGCSVGSYRGGQIDATFVGGTFTTGSEGTDVPVVVFDRYVLGARTPSLPADASPGGLGPVVGLRGEVVLDITPSQTSEQKVTVMLPARSTQVVEPVLDGFALTTDVPQGTGYPTDYNPADGYTSRGLGVSLRDIERLADRVTFTVRVRFAHGPAERPNMNRAIPLANTRATVRYQVLLASSGAATHADVSYRMTYPQAKVLDPTPLPPVTPELTHASGSLPTGYQHAVAALREFEFRLFPDLTVGDYIRELTARVLDLQYDAASGRVALRIDGYASNAGILTEAAMDYFFDAKAVVVGFNAVEAPVWLAERIEFSVPSTTRAMVLSTP